MDDDSSLVLQERDYADIAKLQDPSALEEFLEQPLTFIAESLTGALAVGHNGVLASGGRIVHALLKGRLYKQWKVEFDWLRKNGKIADDFADKKYGFQTWVELMATIDEEAPDADRLEALKAMFFAANKAKATDKEQIYAYQLWQITKKLSSGEVLVVKTIHSHMNLFNGLQYGEWLKRIAEVSGLAVEDMVELHLTRLRELHVVFPHKSDRLMNGGLTALGLGICKNIQNYRTVIGDMKKHG